MPGPATPQEALQWVQEAVASGRYIPTNHLFDQCQNRNITIQDVHSAIRRATDCKTHNDPPKHGGTCWKITGPDYEGAETTVGVEAFQETGQKRAVLCTVY